MPERLFLRQRFKHHGHRVGSGVHIAAQTIAVQVRCASCTCFAGVKRTIRARLRRRESGLQIFRFGQQRRQRRLQGVNHGSVAFVGTAVKLHLCQTGV